MLTVPNVFLPTPTDVVGADKLVVVIEGDFTNEIDIQATQDDPVLNPFAYVNKYFWFGQGQSSIDVSLDAKGNTNITYTGTHPILSSYSFDYGVAANGQPHYGYQGVFHQPFKVLSQTWTNKNGGTDLPTWSAACPALNEPAVRWAVLFAQVLQNGQTTGQWLECPVDAGPFAWTLNNPMAIDEILSNVGLLFSSAAIPLDLLNFASFPPPDQSGSRFLALSQFDGRVLGAGANFSFTVSEPGTLMLLGIGLAGLMEARRRRGVHAGA